MESSDPAAGRVSRRVATTADVRLEFERFSGFLQEMASNVSRGGMFVRTRSLRPPGSKLRFEISLADDWPLVRGSGVVMWTRWRDGGEQQPAGMGIRFEELDAQSRDLVERLVTEQRKAGKSPFDLEAAAPPPEPAPIAAAFEEAEPAGSPASATPAPSPAPVPSVTPPPAHSPPQEVQPPEPVQAIEPLPPPPAREDAPVSPAPREVSSLSGELPTLAQVVASVRRESRPPRLEPPTPQETFAFPEPGHAGSSMLSESSPSLGGGSATREAAWVAPELQAGVLDAGRTPESPSAPGSSRRGRLVIAAAAVLAAIVLALYVRPRLLVSAAPAEVAIAPESVASRVESAPSGAEPAANPAGAQSDPAAAAAAPSARPPAPSSPAAFTAVERITWETVTGGTVVMLWLNGPAPPGTVVRSRIESGGVRELLQLRGARTAFGTTRLEVGTPEVVRIRTGFHPRAGGDEQHVVLDLASAAVRVTGVETRGDQILVRVGAQ